MESLSLGYIGKNRYTQSPQLLSEAQHNAVKIIKLFNI